MSGRLNGKQQTLAAVLRLPLQVPGKCKDIVKIVIAAKRFGGQHNVGGVHTVVHKEISDTAKAFDMGILD